MQKRQKLVHKHTRGWRSLSAGADIRVSFMQLHVYSVQRLRLAHSFQGGRKNKATSVEVKLQ